MTLDIQFRALQLIMIPLILSGTFTFVVIGCVTDTSGNSPVAAGEALFRTPQPTSFETEVACSFCHGDDGSGGTASSVRGATIDAITAVTQDTTTAHPADPRGRTDVKFPMLSTEEIIQIAAFLSN